MKPMILIITLFAAVLVQTVQSGEPVAPEAALQNGITAAERTLGRLERDIKKTVGSCRQAGNEKGADAWLTVRRYVISYKGQIMLTRRLLAMYDLVTDAEKRIEARGVVSDFCRDCTGKADKVLEYLKTAGWRFTSDADQELLKEVHNTVEDAAGAFTLYGQAGK